MPSRQGVFRSNISKGFVARRIARKLRKMIKNLSKKHPVSKIEIPGSRNVLRTRGFYKHYFKDARSKEDCARIVKNVQKSLKKAPGQ